MHDKKRFDETEKFAQPWSLTWDMLTNSVVWSDETYHIFGEIPQSPIATFKRFMSYLSLENSLRAYYFFAIQRLVILIVTIFYVGIVFIARLLQ